MVRTFSGVSTGAGQRDTGPLVRIRSLLPGLARAEKRVARVVLEDPGAVSGHSITEVAEAAGTSETTVTRFCKAIGVSGYPELRIALAGDVARRARVGCGPGGDIAPDADLRRVVDTVTFADARSIDDTGGQLDVAALRGAVDAIAAARRVDVYAVGGSAFVAAALQQKLHRIGRTCFAWHDTHLMLASAAMLGTADVAVAISHSGATTDTVEALRQAASAGATTVVLTNFPRSPLARDADHVLTTATRETTFRSGGMASRIAQLTVADCVFIGVAQRHRKSAVAALEATSAAVTRHRISARPDGRRKEGNR